MRTKEQQLLVERLERIFPTLELYFPPDYDAPPHTIDWDEFINELEKNGLTITNAKTL